MRAGLEGEAALVRRPDLLLGGCAHQSGIDVHDYLRVLLDILGDEVLGPRRARLAPSGSRLARASDIPAVAAGGEPHRQIEHDVSGVADPVPGLAAALQYHGQPDIELTGAGDPTVSYARDSDTEPGASRRT